MQTLKPPVATFWIAVLTFAALGTAGCSGSPARPDGGDGVSPAAAARPTVAAAPAEAVPASPAPEPEERPSAEDAEVRQLEARILELSRQLSARQLAAKGSEGSGTTPAAMLRMLEERDGPALHLAMEQLLLSGEEGYKVLLDYFRLTEAEGEIITLTHDPLLLYAMLRLVANYPDRVAEICLYLMEATRSTPDSYIRREIFNFVPVFVAHYPGRYEEVREQLKQEIVAQIESGLDYPDKVFFAFRTLGFEPPLEAFATLLLKSDRRHVDSMAIGYVARRGEKALDLLTTYVETIGAKNAAGLGEALRGIDQIDRERGTHHLDAFLDHEKHDVRRAATLIYFSVKRDLDSMPYLLGFLNTAGSVRSKRAMVRRLGQTSQDLLMALEDRITEIGDERVRQMVRQEIAVASRSVPKRTKTGGEP